MTSRHLAGDYANERHDRRRGGRQDRGDDGNGRSAAEAFVRGRSGRFTFLKHMAVLMLHAASIGDVPRGVSVATSCDRDLHVASPTDDFYDARLETV